MSKFPGEGFTVGIPDPTFKLSPEQRTEVHPYFDADALERLLGMMPPEARPDTFSRFVRPAEWTGRVRYLVSLGHPALQEALEEVWLPFWAGMSDEEMEAQPDVLPGRELARRRRLGPEPKEQP